MLSHLPGGFMPHVTTAIFERQAPAFVGAELDRLYGARYCSLLHFRDAGTLADASTYVARTDGVVTAVFLYARRRGVVRVLNEGIRVTPQDAAAFAAYIFARYPGVGAIQWHGVDTGAGAPAAPHQRLACAEDIVMALPASAAAYLASLGSSTRANVKLRLNRLKRAYPAWAFGVAERSGVDPAEVREIIRLSRLRMRSKGKISTTDNAEEERIVRTVAECGYVTTIRIDGQLCAGMVAFRQGSNFSMRVLAHADGYDAYRLGFVCAYLTISACAALPGSAMFHFGWGNEDYKFRLGGRLRELSTLLVYRSRWHALLAARLAWSVRWGGLVFRLRQRVLPLLAWWRARRAR